jgi:hypothetical protein
MTSSATISRPTLEYALAMYAQLRRLVGYGWIVGTLYGCSWSRGSPARTQPSGREDVVMNLDRRMQYFAASFDSISAPGFLKFFPREGDVVYRHTRHTPEGSEIIVKRLLASEISDALQQSGALWPSFQLQFEEQPVGLLPSQVMVRRGTWRRVAESRFVPPDADGISPTYVDWRREGPNWVISELGDESFIDVPLPPWMLQ